MKEAFETLFISLGRISQSEDWPTNIRERAESTIEALQDSPRVVEAQLESLRAFSDQSADPWLDDLKLFLDELAPQLTNQSLAARCIEASSDLTTNHDAYRLLLLSRRSEPLVIENSLRPLKNFTDLLSQQNDLDPETAGVLVAVAGTLLGLIDRLGGLPRVEMTKVGPDVLELNRLLTELDDRLEVPSSFTGPSSDRRAAENSVDRFRADVGSNLEAAVRARTMIDAARMLDLAAKSLAPINSKLKEKLEDIQEMERGFQRAAAVVGAIGAVFAFLAA